MGILRFALALGVVAYHLSPQVFGFAGPAAVFGFYTVSGYLITGALATNYVGRIGAFIFNRFLRLYPAYWAALVLALVALHFGQSHNRVMTMPASLDDLWRQLTVFGLLHGDGSAHPVRLVPPAWSLNMELVWYLLLVPLHRHSFVWLAASTAIAGYYIFAGASWVEPYYSYLGPSFCFALGSACWRLKEVPAAWRRPRIAICAVILVMLLGSIVGHEVWLLYLSSLVTGLAIVGLRSMVQSTWERHLGDLSYPVFLCHWQVAAFIPLERGPVLLMVSIVPVLVTALVMVICVEKPLARYRDRIRSVQRGVPSPVHP